ncbi:MAG: LysR family transcriptional regulator, partial [Oscillospiraceae bacterium]|nr:LysR family transcriptional regulator [Oscillospiraceae bacterium]
MSIFQLLCFVTLSNTATFSEAAEKLYISQSSFSYNIQTIEKELGVSLVIREKGILALTEAGRAFLSYAKKIVEEYEHLNELLRDCKHSAENRVLFYTDPLNSYSYNELIANFKLSYPEIQTEIVELVNERFDDIIKTQKDVVGIVFSTNKETDPGTKCHTLISDRLAILVGKSHRLTGCARIKLHDIEDEMIQTISFRQSQFLNEFILRQFRNANLIPNIAPLDLWYTTVRATISDLGIPAVLPESAARLICMEDTKVVGIDTEEFYIKVIISDECTHSA